MVTSKKISNYLLACCALMSGASVAVCQDTGARQVAPSAKQQVPATLEVPATADGNPAANTVQNGTTYASPFDAGQNGSTFASGTPGFENFIGFISNPAQSIDPRALSQIFPIFGGAWATGNRPILPDANAQVYGAGLSVAVSDRFSLGLTQGGYAVMDINSNRERLLAKLGLPVPDRDRSGQREGWLNLGGYFQYTLIADVPDQFILTAGLRWEAPSGATQVFQGGANPPYLAPYLTAGQALGCWHILGTTGFEFPAGSGTATTDTFYLNLHADRQFGWFYPLVELNGSYHMTTVDLDLPARHGVIDLGTFQSTSNMLTIAVGANAVIIPNKLEVGAVYSRPITSQDHFEFNGMLLKVVYRF